SGNRSRAMIGVSANLSESSASVSDVDAAKAAHAKAGARALSSALVRFPKRGTARLRYTAGRVAVACLTLAACHREPVPAAPGCRDALAELAAFFTAVAAEQDA